LRREARKQAE
jgi:hypothetical protein